MSDEQAPDAARAARYDRRINRHLARALEYATRAETLSGLQRHLQQLPGHERDRLVQSLDEEMLTEIGCLANHMQIVRLGEEASRLLGRMTDEVKNRFAPAVRFWDYRNAFNHPEQFPEPDLSWDALPAMAGQLERAVNDVQRNAPGRTSKQRNNAKAVGRKLKAILDDVPVFSPSEVTPASLLTGLDHARAFCEMRSGAYVGAAQDAWTKGALDLGPDEQGYARLKPVPLTRQHLDQLLERRRILAHEPRAPYPAPLTESFAGGQTPAHRLRQALEQRSGQPYQAADPLIAQVTQLTGTKAGDGPNSWQAQLRRRPDGNDDLPPH